MGCTSSTPVDAKHAPIPRHVDENNHEKKREKKITAGTETMIVSRHDDEIDAAAAAAATTTITTTSGGHEKKTRKAAASTKVVVGDLTLRYACRTRQGRDPDDASKPNQDCYSVQHHHHHHKNNNNNNDSSNSSSNATAFFAVYDGHGPHGEACSQFAQQRLPDLVNKHILQSEKEYMVLTIDQVQESLHKAHTECNDELHSSQINDSYSGTTSISLYIHDQNRITVSNVGDSRAVLGKARSAATGASSSLLAAIPLSKDQTPHRLDEAARCVRSGARILSFGQIDPSSRNDSDDSQVEDPPRVWAPTGKYPGTAFTRSIGDAVAETLGVYAEPEMMTFKLSPEEQVLIVLASDGIFDVMSNQEVIDLCFRYRFDPMQACNAVIEKSHQEWLENEDCIDEQSASYDDMTIICLFFGHYDDDEKSRGAFVSEAATASVANDNVQVPTATAQGQRVHTKRVRQKTLRHLEEMEET